MIIFEYSIPLFWILTALFAAAGIGIYSAWRFLPPNRLSAGLSALFIIALALVFWALLQPGKRDATTELIKPRFLVALDTSLSMTVAPSEDAVDRWETSIQALTMPWIRTLGAECQIEVLPFDSKIGQVMSPRDAAQMEPSGHATLLRECLREITGRYAGLNVAGLLLLSDGLDTREAFDDWAREERPFPIYTVRLEADMEWDLPPDLRVDAVTTPQRATLNWATELKALLYGQGTDGKPVTAQLFKDDVLIDEIPTRFPDEGGQREVVFTLQHPEPGIFTYRVFLPPLPGETSTNDNEFAVSVRVAEDRNRLLYVEGIPRWEYRFLRRALLATPNVTPAIFYTGPDGSPRTGAPAGDITANMTEEELAHFQVVILGNMDAEELTEERANNLVEFVETGGSLILLGGNKAWGPNGFSQTSLSKIMPARSHGTQPLEADPSDTPFTVQITDEARAHPAFAGDDTWDNVPSVLSVLPDVVPTLGAQVLAEVNTPRGTHPMVLSHRYGDGKVAAIFTDSLWRWQLAASDPRQTQPYQRFWGQLTEWMLPDDDDIETQRIHLFADRDRLFLGEELEISARVPGSDERPPDQVEALVSFPDEREVPYTMSPRHIVTPSGETFGGYALDFEPGLPGHYTAVAVLTEGRERITSDPVSFFVQPHTQETAPRPIASDILQALAAASGGRFFETLDDMNRALSVLQTAAIREEQIRFFSLWQRWPFILILMAALAGAWTARKLRNMP